MDRSQIEGIGHQVKGVPKQNHGKFIGDAKLKADGATKLGDAPNAIDADSVGPHSGIAEREAGKTQNAAGSQVRLVRVRGRG